MDKGGEIPGPEEQGQSEAVLEEMENKCTYILCLVIMTPVSVLRRIGKENGICIYILSLKKKEILPFVTTQMNMGNITLNEINRIWKDKSCPISLLVESKQG